jgi:hypothetical protein
MKHKQKHIIDDNARWPEPRESNITIGAVIKFRTNQFGIGLGFWDSLAHRATYPPDRAV